MRLDRVPTRPRGLVENGNVARRHDRRRLSSISTWTARGLSRLGLRAGRRDVDVWRYGRQRDVRGRRGRIAVPLLLSAVGIGGWVGRRGGPRRRRNRRWDWRWRLRHGHGRA